MKRAITLPSGKRVSVGAYASAWRKLKTLPGETEVEGWNWFGATRADRILAEMRAGMMDRINQAIPAMERGKAAA